MKRAFAWSLATVMSLALSISHALPASLEVVGTGDGMEIVRAIGAAFMEENPEIQVIVPPSIGSGGGIAAVGSGRATLARVARPLKQAERESGLIAKPVFRLPTAIYVNRDVPVRNLSYEDVAAIFEGAIKNWKQVGGPDLRIKVVRREDTDSSLTVLRRSMPGWAGLELTPRSKIALTTQDAVESVRSNTGAIGFGPYSKVLETVVNVLSINGLSPRDPTYESAVTVAYVWRDSLITDEARAFLDYCSSAKALSVLRKFGASPATLAMK